jgi:hypothetical protein
VRDRTELGPHETYPTLAAKVGPAEDKVASVGKVSTRARSSPGPMETGPRGPITRQV